MKRHLEGVSQKSLTQCLRRLECDGLLLETFRLLYAWVLDNMPTLDAARRLFDGPATAS